MALAVIEYYTPADDAMLWSFTLQEGLPAIIRSFLFLMDNLTISVPLDLWGRGHQTRDFIRGVDPIRARNHFPVHGNNFSIQNGKWSLGISPRKVPRGEVQIHLSPHRRTAGFQLQ